MGGKVSRLCNRALPVIGRLNMIRVVADNAIRVLPVFGCFLLNHKPMKASSARQVGGRIRALAIFLIVKSICGLYRALCALFV